MVEKFHENAICMISDLVEQLRDPENGAKNTLTLSSTPTSAPNFDTMIAVLTKEMETAGANGLENVKVIHINGGVERTLVTTRDIKKGEFVSSIPV